MISIENIQKNKKNKDHAIRGLLRKSSIKPPELRMIVDEIFYATQGGPFNMRTLAARCEQDQLLSERIMQICACPYYSGRTPIRGMSQLIQRLGPTGFRCIAMQAFLDLEIFVGPAWSDSLLKLKRYSVVIAHITRLVCRLTSIHGDTAFLAGLLHRIGMAVPLKTLPDPQKEPALMAEIWAALEICHPILSNLIVRARGMNEEIQDAIGAYGQVYHNGKPNQIAAAILVAEQVATKLGVELSGNRRKPRNFRLPPKASIDECLQVLGMNPEDLSVILKESKLVLKNSLSI